MGNPLLLRVDEGTKKCKRCFKGRTYKKGHDVTCQYAAYYIGGGVKGSGIDKGKDKDKDKAENRALKEQEIETKKKDNLARSLKGVNEEKQAAEKKKQEKKAEKEKTEKEEKEQATEKKKQEANARA